MLTVPQRISRVIWCTAATVAALHAASTLTGLDGSAIDWVASGWTPFGIFAACAATCLTRSMAADRDHAAWLALGIGLALYALGQAYYLLVTSHDPEAGFVTVPTFLWLAIYPLALFAIVQLVRARGVRARRDLCLDGLIGGLAIAALGVTLVYGLVVGPLPILDAAPTNVAFAVGDMVVVGFGVGTCALLGWRPPRSLAMLLAGFVALGCQDVAYLQRLLEDASAVGGFLDSAWLIALLLVAAPAAWSAASDDTRQPAEPAARIGFPVAFAVIAVGLSIYEGFANVGSHLPALLTALTLAAVVARFAATFRSLTSMIAALDRSEAHLAQAQRVAGIGSWYWDRASDRVTWSAQQKRLHGWRRPGNPAGLAGIVETIEPADRPAVRTTIERAINAGEQVSIDYRIRLPGGNVRWLHGEGEIVRDADGEVTGLVGTSQDMTERFRAVEAERASQAKSEFLSQMSHELRTPLNAILGFGQLLEAADFDEPHRSSVRHILTSGRHLLALVNEVLEIARIEAGELSVSLEPVRVGCVVEDAIDLVSPRAAGRGVRLVTRGHDDVWVAADHQRLKQVLLNLLDNAIKYNHEGGTVEVRVTKASPQRVQIAVSDTGRGIAPEIQHRLFTPFERLGAEHRNVEGTGLGLSLSKGLAEAMGGGLDVDSSPGAGSTFTVELAAAPAGLAPEASTSVTPGIPGPGVTRHKLLCVEDDASNLKLIEQIFARRPVELITAVQGSTGAELAREHQPDLVILDLNLPDIDGDVVLERLADDPATAGIPVVIVSADATQRQVERLLSLGAHAYVTKPIDVAEFLRVVDDALVAPAGGG